MADAQERIEDALDRSGDTDVVRYNGDAVAVGQSNQLEKVYAHAVRYGYRRFIDLLPDDNEYTVAPVPDMILASKTSFNDLFPNMLFLGGDSERQSWALIKRHTIATQVLFVQMDAASGEASLVSNVEELILMYPFKVFAKEDQSNLLKGLVRYVYLYLREVDLIFGASAAAFIQLTSVFNAIGEAYTAIGFENILRLDKPSKTVMVRTVAENMKPPGVLCGQRMPIPQPQPQRETQAKVVNAPQRKIATTSEEIHKAIAGDPKFVLSDEDRLCLGGLRRSERPPPALSAPVAPPAPTAHPKQAPAMQGPGTQLASAVNANGKRSRLPDFDEDDMAHWERQLETAERMVDEAKRQIFRLKNKARVQGI